MGCSRYGMERWQAKMGRMQEKMDRMRTRMGGGGGFGFWQPPSSGNRAFDEYRAETLRRLEDEQREFQDFLARLREAKDKAEFDQFMADRAAAARRHAAVSDIRRQRVTVAHSRRLEAPAGEIRRAFSLCWRRRMIERGAIARNIVSRIGNQSLTTIGAG